MDINVIIKKIKEKSTLKRLDEAFIAKRIKIYFRENQKLERILSNHPRPLKSKQFALLLKDLRKEMHAVYGIFQLGNIGLEQLKAYLEKKKKIDNKALDIHRELLKRHKSSLERLPYYPEIYKKIFNVTGRPSIILDLACGLNPLSLPWMHLNNARYFATELSSEDCKIIQDYFNIIGKYFKLYGYAFPLDLQDIKHLPKADVCFLFKVLDSLESLKKDISYEIINKIHSRFIVVSFPTRSIGGRKMIKERGWFFKLLRSFNFDCTQFSIENEMFYIIKK